MAFVEDTKLLGKKILVTILIYLVPVTIIVGGLILTRSLLDDSAESVRQELIQKTETAKL